MHVIEDRRALPWHPSQSTPKTDHVEKVFPWHPPNCQVHRHKKLWVHSILFRIQETARSPYTIALVLFFAVRSRSPTRAFCSPSLLFLSYLLHTNRLRSRCLSSRRWRSASPSTSNHSLCSLRSAFLSTECFPFAPHKLSDQQHMQMSLQIRSARGSWHAYHAWIRMRKTVLARRGRGVT